MRQYFYFALIALSVSCREQGAETTFTQVQSNVLVPSCSFSSCHGSGTGGLAFDGSTADYSELVNALSLADPNKILVVPGDSDASYLIQKLEGSAGIIGDPMPPGALLSPAVIESVRDWIDAGALP